MRVISPCYTVVIVFHWCMFSVDVPRVCYCATWWHSIIKFVPSAGEIHVKSTCNRKHFFVTIHPSIPMFLKWTLPSFSFYKAIVANGGVNQIITKTWLYNFDPLKPFLCSKTGVNRGIHYFPYFCSKTLWVFVRTALPRWFQRVPKLYI